MAGWSILTAESDFDCIEILRNLQRSGFCLDIDASSVKLGLDGNKDKLRCLFDQILTVFLKEISLSYDIRPVPAMLGDGRRVDLFKLFRVVREKGGYHLVSKKTGLWCLVAEECRFGSEFASAIKLIYIKYLDTLDRWVRDKGIGGGGLVDNGGNLGVLSKGLETELKDLVYDTLDHDHEKKDEEFIQLNSEDIENPVLFAGKECISDKDEKVMTSECSENSNCSKRKREILSGMLNWVSEIAKNPSDPATGKSLKFSKHNGNGNGGEEFCGQVLKAREALLHTRNFYLSADRPLLQKKRKMHPSIYEDPIGANQLSTERLRCSQRLFSRMQSHSSRSHSESSETDQTDLDISQTPSFASFKVEHPYKQSPEITDSLALDRGVYLFGNDHLRNWVCVGALYQAEVPEWTGVASESDSKWLGEQHWPLTTAEKRPSLIERDPIGKGRQDSCGCRRRGSVECIRFHITEKRMRLKLELGSAFYNWRFFCMGEEVSLAWTEEEEKKFKAIVRLNPPSLNKCFWDQALRSFPSKKRHGLVSYYFNVFLLRRRSYQNRVTPNNIDSDDDESEFGSVSNGFGLEAVKVPGSKSIFCAQNNQCIDLD
ncbi:ARID/BRIGHT DNA-binding domain [Macleaya cordata]|uniref:ARID/BRIGHT DNA-binding domain n=1 Tax=Macleaya cordata TaxID=56857 RepID=A0A200R9J8_MACCD|nr:ARID/BRIGHT DNA-binding domain [Macleaya cordata]